MRVEPEVNEKDWGKVGENWRKNILKYFYNMVEKLKMRSNDQPYLQIDNSDTTEEQRSI